AAPNGGGADVKPAGRRKKMRGHHGDETLSHEEKGVGHDRGIAHGPPRITLCVGDTLTAARALLSRGPSSPPSSCQQNQNQNQNQNQEHQHDGSVGAEVSRRRHRKVGVLNMASPLAPGGGFLNGATGPEASLCLRTTLLPALRDEFYRLPELGVVYTPDVLVFRPTTSSPSPGKPADDGTGGSEDRGEGSGIAEDDSREEDILPKNDRWFVDVVSAAMLRLPETTSSETENGRTEYALASDRELAERKMRAVLRVFAARGCGAVVLSAWGCGVYEGNPVSEIAAAWRRVLGVEVGGDGHHHQHQHHRQISEDGIRSSGKPPVSVPAQRHEESRKAKWKGGSNDKKICRSKEKKGKEPWASYISDVVFAIKDRGTATAFARAFGEDYILSSPASPSSPSSTIDDEEEEDPVEVARVSELREKIAQLETQVAQVRSPHLKVGLESVLVGLRRQLPPEGGDDNDNDDEPSSSGLGQSYSGGTDEDGDEDNEDEDDENYDEEGD
ncbi:hypothetical protein CHU98_g3069, partial [Xylaria longipes]